MAPCLPPAIAQHIDGSPPAGTDTLNFTTTAIAHTAGLSTLFTCTNLNSDTANIAVQIFDQNGSTQNASPALVVPPGSTVQFATTGPAPFSPDWILSPVNAFTKAAAKFWSDHKLIHCVVILEPSVGSSLSTVNLPLIAQGKKQRGD